MELFSSPIKVRQPEVSSAISHTDARSVHSELSGGDMRSFNELGLNPWLCKCTKAMGFERPTMIQKLCIPAVLRGRNVMVSES